MKYKLLLSQERYNEIDFYAKKSGKTVNEFIEDAIKETLQKLGEKKMNKIIIQTGVDDEKNLPKEIISNYKDLEIIRNFDFDKLTKADLYLGFNGEKFEVIKQRIELIEGLEYE